ncbi:hypothetical protein MUP77_17275 [Candidatus Bathyarchaeota archaeon]|nr:hypothetical protein [Candidatus Bathyarchaeota archaeon]
MVKCGRKEKHQYKIEHGLNLRRRRKEKNNIRTKSLPDLKGNSPDRPALGLNSCCRLRAR